MKKTITVTTRIATTIKIKFHTTAITETKPTNPQRVNTSTIKKDFQESSAVRKDALNITMTNVAMQEQPTPEDKKNKILALVFILFILLLIFIFIYAKYLIGKKKQIQ